jgi:hypothetical protein
VDSCPQDLEQGKKDELRLFGRGTSDLARTRGSARAGAGNFGRAQMRGRQRGRGDERTPLEEAAARH